MRYYLTSLYTLLTILAFAQVPTGDIEKDTALARQYFEEVNAASNEFQRSERALLISQQAILLYEAHPFNSKLINLKGNLSHILRIQKKYDEAKEVALSAIALGKENLPSYPVHQDLKLSYWTMFWVNKQFSDEKKAIEFALLTMKCPDKMPVGYFEISGELAECYTEIEDVEILKESLNQLETVIKEAKEGKLDKYIPIIYIQKIFLYTYLGFDEQVIAYGQKFEEENNKHLTYDQNDVFDAYHEVVSAYQNLDDFESAFEWLDKCLKIAKAINYIYGISTIYGEIGYTYNYIQKPEEAIIPFKKAIEYLLSDSILDVQNISAQYNNLASSFLFLEEFDKAENALNHAIEYSKGNSANYRLLGKIYSRKGDYEAALKEIQKALVAEFAEFKPKNINENPPLSMLSSSQVARMYSFDKASYIFEIGKLQNDKTKLETGIRILKTILSIEEQKWQETKGFEQSRFSINRTLVIIMSRIISHYYEMYELMPSDDVHNQLFELMEKRKAMQLIETISPSSLPNKLYEQEKELVRAIQAQTYQFDLATMRGEKDSISYYRDKVIEANTAMAEYLEYIKEEYPKEANHFYNQDFATSEAIQKNISEEILFIEYATTGSKVYISTISQSEKKVFQVDFNAINIQKLNELIQDRFAFQKPVREEFIEISHELYQTLIQPIETELEGKTKIMIVLEGQLFHLPFELLLKSNEKKPYHELDFLIKKYEVNYHYSATAFLKLQEKETAKDNSLLAFAPIFSKGDELTTASRSLDFMVDSVYRSIENFEFVALPSTKKEVNTIAKLIKSNDGKANVLLSKNATKQKLSTQLESQSYQFVHIATHGLVNFKNPKLSALACYSKDETMDNLMYANEIQFKNINADLVVLSSCESGIGQLVAGEGLIALNRSFIYSGAKNVLFSLWKVSDKYSSELMIDFYKSYFETESYTTALRQAKLKMLANPTSAQPKYWSAFVLMGE